MLPIADSAEELLPDPVLSRLQRHDWAKAVIHYAGFATGFGRGPVEDVSLEHFAHGRHVRVRSATTPRFDREQVVERARSRLGERRYRLLSNNFEHFAEWCLGGESWPAAADPSLPPIPDTQLEVP